MPIYEYRVYTLDGTPTDEIIEHICSWNKKPKRLSCSDGRYAVPMMSIPAKTPGLWHDGWSNGLDGGEFSYALGRKVANKTEEAREMKRRGFIPESDLGKDFVANTQETLANRWQKQADYAATYQENLKTMAPEDAVAATWSAEDCLSGVIDDTYSTDIKGV